MNSTQKEEVCKSPEFNSFHPGQRYNDGYRFPDDDGFHPDAEQAFRRGYAAGVASAAASDDDGCLGDLIADAEKARRDLKDRLCIAHTPAGDIPWLEYLAGEDAAMEGGTLSEVTIPGVRVGDIVEPDDTFKRFTYAPGKFETEAVAYWPGGHQVEASEARGRHHALIVALDFLCELDDSGIGASMEVKAMAEWKTRCDQWASEEKPSRPTATPLPKAIEAIRQEIEAVRRDEEHEKELEIARNARAAAKTAPRKKNPNSLPDSLLRWPGFVGEVADYIYRTSPSPDWMLSTVAAISLQSALIARKLRSPTDLRSNLMLLVLAPSGSGKNRARQVNTDIMVSAGLTDVLREDIGSGQGVQDQLRKSPVLYYQCDEMDALLNAVKKSSDGSMEPAISTLLKLYSSSNSRAYVTRSLAGQPTDTIDQPSLTLYGTAVAQHFYDSLSEKMLTQGFFSRCMVFELDDRYRESNRNLVDEPVPESILEAARYWAGATTHQGDLERQHPKPRIVPYSSGGERILDEALEIQEYEVNRANKNGDAVAGAAWSRYREQAIRLALVYAASANRVSPVIDEAAAATCTAIAKQQVRMMLSQAGKLVGVGRIGKLCEKALVILRTCKAMTLPRSVFANRLHVDDSRELKLVISTLGDRGDAVEWKVDRSTFVTAADLFRGRPKNKALAEMAAETGKQAGDIANVLGI